MYRDSYNRCWHCSHDHDVGNEERCLKSFCNCPKKPMMDRTREKSETEIWNKEEMERRPEGCTCDRDSHGNLSQWKTRSKVARRTASNHLSGCPHRARKTCKETLMLKYDSGLEISFNCTNQSHKYRGTHSHALENQPYGGGPRIHWDTGYKAKRGEDNEVVVRINQ